MRAFTREAGSNTEKLDKQVRTQAESFLTPNPSLQLVFFSLPDPVVAMLPCSQISAITLVRSLFS